MRKTTSNQTCSRLTLAKVIIETQGEFQPCLPCRWIMRRRLCASRQNERNSLVELYSSSIPLAYIIEIASIPFCRNRQIGCLFNSRWDCYSKNVIRCLQIVVCCLKIFVVFLRWWWRWACWSGIAQKWLMSIIEDLLLGYRNRDADSLDLTDYCCCLTTLWALGLAWGATRSLFLKASRSSGSESSCVVSVVSSISVCWNPLGGRPTFLCSQFIFLMFVTAPWPCCKVWGLGLEVEGFIIWFCVSSGAAICPPPWSSGAPARVSEIALDAEVPGDIGRTILGPWNDPLRPLAYRTSCRRCSWFPHLPPEDWCRSEGRNGVALQPLDC